MRPGIVTGGESQRWKGRAGGSVPGTSKATSAFTVVSPPQITGTTREINNQTNQNNKTTRELTRTDGGRDLESRAPTLPIPEPESLRFSAAIKPILAIKPPKLLN
jgi:hypothetical protein